MFQNKPEGRRKSGQPTLRWIEPVENCLVGNEKEEMKGKTRVMEENEHKVSNHLRVLEASVR
jgi:hypothetical protein